MAKVILREGESFEQLLRRFKLQVRRAGIIEEAKRREYYEKPSVVRKREEEQKKRRIAQRERLG